MFTVLIAEKEHINAIQQENKLFFEPFLDNKELAFCYWNPDGQSLIDSVPGLVDAVGRQKKWRAVIINNKSDSMKTQNPFDVADCSAIKDLTKPHPLLKEGDDYNAWEASWKNFFKSYSETKEKIYKSALENPLSKLCTWLCYKPEDYILNEAKEKQDVHDWAMEEIRKDAPKNASLELESMEREQYKNELRIKETLRREFVAGQYLNVAYPSEVHCISLRTAESSFFDPDNAWSTRSEYEYVPFSDYNMFFDKMRFMVFDLLPSTHRDYRTDYIRFLATVLIIASNQLPSSAMLARRLYQLEVETDDTPLCMLITSYDSKLAATSEVIENEMEKIRSEIPDNMTDKDVEAILAAPRDVSVVLDSSCDPQKVQADNDYGLFYDSPENEFDKWTDSYNTSKTALAYIVKQQSRAVRKSVIQAQLSSGIPDIDVSRLTALQVDDIRDYTDMVENNMIDAIPTDFTDASRYNQKLDAQSENVKKIIRRRMTIKTTLIIGGCFMGLFLLCFLPFLFSNGSTPKTVTTAIIMTAIMMGLLAAVMVVALFIMRMPLKKAVKDYNEAAHEITNNIAAALKSFSVYLSAFCNVRRGHAVQNCARKNVNQYVKKLRIRQKHLEDIRKKRAYLAEEYRDYLGDKSFCDETMARPYEYDFDFIKEHTYPAPFLAGDSRQITLISSGNYVTVPSSYVKSISVRMEDIYE